MECGQVLRAYLRIYSRHGQLIVEGNCSDILLARDERLHFQRPSIS